MAGPGDQEKWQNLRSSCAEYPHCAKGGEPDGGVGMPNKESGGGEGDWIHPANGGVVTFFGVAGTLTEDWIENAANRYDYLEAMADLFLWPGSGTVKPNQGEGTRSEGSRPDPRYDQGNPTRQVKPRKWETAVRSTNTYSNWGGLVCVPDSQSDIKLFVRCCGDQLSERCLDCPAGRTNAAGNRKTFDDCVCPGGADFNEKGECA